MALDRRFKILPSQQPNQPLFLTSDDPAVLTNRWYLQRINRQDFGIGSAGVILLLPLTPRVCALCYDGDVYHVTNVNGWSNIVRVEDVLAVNEHQYLKCMANIYFSNWSDLERIRKEFSVMAQGRLARSTRITVADLVESGAKGETFRSIPAGEASTSRKSLLHMQTMYPVPQRWPSVIRYRSNPSIYTNGSAMGFVRRSFVGAEGGANFRKYKGRTDWRARRGKPAWEV